MARLSLAVLVSGRGSNLRAIIDSIQAGSLDAEVLLVLSDRRSALALDIAAEAGIPAVVVSRVNRFEEIDRHICEAGADLVVMAGFMRIVPVWFVERYAGRLINIHPSLLPAFPGLHAQRQALQHGVKVSGCTVHFVDGGCDTGPIIMQVAVPVLAGDDEESLSERILVQEHRLLPEVIGLIGCGRVELIGQAVQVRLDDEGGRTRQ